MKRTFYIWVVYSLVNGRLLVPFDKVHEFAEFIVGGPVWTHELIAVRNAALPYFAETLPGLQEFEWIGEFDAEGGMATMNALEERYGRDVEVEEGCLSSALRGKSPVDTLVELVGPEKVVIVDPSNI